MTDLKTVLVLVGVVLVCVSVLTLVSAQPQQATPSDASANYSHNRNSAYQDVEYQYDCPIGPERQGDESTYLPPCNNDEV